MKEHKRKGISLQLLKHVMALLINSNGMCKSQYHGEESCVVGLVMGLQQKYCGEVHNIFCRCNPLIAAQAVHCFHLSILLCS